MKALAYIRVSTKQQGEEDKYGVDLQKSRIEEYAKANGIEITDFVIEEGSGAYEREKWNEICFSPLEGTYDSVIVFKNDRVARDTKLYFYYLYVLEKKGIKLISCEEQFDDGDGFANIYRAILQFVAEQERKNITLRTSLGRKQKASTGGYAGGKPPYGYKVVAGKLEVNFIEAENVRIVFALHNQGHYVPRIVKFLNEEGYTYRGKKWTEPAVRRILWGEQTYKGYYHYAGSDWIKGQHQAILD